MIKYILFFSLFITTRLFAQPWPGYNTSMYAGIHALSYQPEIHSVMPADWDINVLSANLTFFNENLFGWDPVGDVKRGNIHSIEDIFQNHTGVINGTIKLPSFAVRLNDRSTIGFSWSIRGILFSRISDSGLSDFLNDIEDPNVPVASFDGDFARGIFTSWSQYGFFYSREIFNKNRNRLFGGITLNILSGKGSAYLDLSNLSFNYSDEVITDIDLSFEMALSEEADKLISGQGIPLFKKIGFGTDLGITYERLKNEQSGSSYKYKLGFSVINLGKINYTNSTSISSIRLQSDNVSKESFSHIESLTQLRDTLASVFDLNIEEANTIPSRLPLDIHVTVDFNLYKRFYIHVGYNRQITYFGNEKYKDLSFDKYYVVPRYESEKIGVYLPITYDKFLAMQTGIAFRWKPLVIGSGNILSYFFKGENSTSLDIYFATRIMINRKKK